MAPRLLPRRLEPRVAQLRRDLRAIVNDLRGQRMPPYLPRDGARYAATKDTSAGMGLSGREVEVIAAERETPDTVSLTFRDPSGASLGPIVPGQFFTLALELDGQPFRRAYSVCSDCSDPSQVTVTSKRVDGGRVSNYLNDQAKAGMRLRVLGPSGNFGVTPEPGRETPRPMILIAGGSGITPMMALIRTLLRLEPGTSIALVYANRSAYSIIFAEALAELAAEYPQRLEIVEIVEQASPEWSGPVGRAEPSVLAPILDGLALSEAPGVEYFLCGPTPMMEGATTLLRERGVAAEHIHRESFLARPESRTATTDPLPTTPQALTIALGEREVGLMVRPGQTLLDAGLAAGLDMPFSCAMGGCGACMVTLERGDVAMREPNCLGPAEREAGQILACCSRPRNACRVRVSEAD